MYLYPNDSPFFWATHMGERITINRSSAGLSSLLGFRCGPFATRLSFVIRRVAGLALGAFMLHLNVVRADLTCATHSHDRSSQDRSSHSAHEHGAPASSHSMSMHAEHAVTSTESCDAPVQVDCCSALVTCSVALGLNTHASWLSAMTSHDLVDTVAQNAPLSRTGAPEPPPPKA